MYSYGLLPNGLSIWRKKFVKKCKQVGVNGLIIVDLPWPDNKEFAKLCKKFNHFRSAFHQQHQEKE